MILWNFPEDNLTSNHHRIRKKDDDEKINDFTAKMFIICRDLCLLLGILFTCIIIVRNSQEKSYIPESKPFFSISREIVDDYYKGGLYLAILKAYNSDISFLMLYAPWDADSQKARKEFETSCKFYFKQIYCAAINCWYSREECEVFFNNINLDKFPVFAVNIRNAPLIMYKGVQDSAHMIRFISNILHPVQRIRSELQFKQLQSTRDPLIVSFIPMSSKMEREVYYNYYLASVKYLETDPVQNVCWVVVTSGELADVLDIESLSIKMFLWNNTKIYHGPMVKNNILDWVQNGVYFLVPWLPASLINSTLLSDSFSRGPTVLLFTPHNQYLELTHLYLLLQEITLWFHNCDDDGKINSRIRYIKKRLNDISEEVNELQKKCNSRSHDDDFPILTTCTDMLLKLNKRQSSHSSTNDFYPPNYCLQYNYDNTTISNLNFERKEVPQNSCENDNVCPLRLISFDFRIQCRKANIRKKRYNYMRYNGYCNNTDDLAVKNFRGLACRTNKTISFIAVDSFMQTRMPVNIGIDLENTAGHTALVIVDELNESLYVLPNNVPINIRTVSQFLMDFMDNKLPRWLKSTENSSLYVHRFNEVKNVTSDEITSVKEVHSSLFHSYTFNIDMTVVVYLYSPYCSFCGTSVHEFLAAAYALRNLKEISFVKIDGENNDFHWNLTPHRFPTIIIFPADRKSESQIFPESMALVEENIVEFTLSNILPELKMKHIIDRCIEDSIKPNVLATRRRKPPPCVKNIKEFYSDTAKKLYGLYQQALSRTLSNSMDLVDVLRILKWRIQNLNEGYSLLKSAFFGL